MKPEMQALTSTAKAIILMCEAAPQPMAAIQGVLKYAAGIEYPRTAHMARLLCAMGLLRREGDGYRATQSLNEWTDADPGTHQTSTGRIAPGAKRE